MLVIVVVGAQLNAMAALVPLLALRQLRIVVFPRAVVVILLLFLCIFAKSFCLMRSRRPNPYGSRVGGLARVILRGGCIVILEINCVCMFTLASSICTR